MRALITGGAGFIGSNIARCILEKSKDNVVYIFDTFDDNSLLENGNKKYLGNFNNLLGLNVSIIVGNIAVENDLKQLFDYDFDVIFHMAAISDTRASNQNEILRVNLASFNSIISLAKIKKAKLIYASSAAVYGTQSIGSKCAVGVERPENIYAYSKYMMDQLIINSSHSKLPDSGVVGLRYFNVYGSGETYKEKTASTILQFRNQILQNRQITLFENSDSIYRDFVYIRDVVELTLRASKLDGSHCLNIGSGSARSFMDVAELVSSYFGVDNAIRTIPNPYKEGYQYFTLADMELTNKVLNVEPIYSLEMGVSDYLDKL